MPPSGFSTHDTQHLDNFLLGCFQRVLEEHDDIRSGLAAERRHIATALKTDLRALGGNQRITRAVLEMLDAFYERIERLPDAVLNDDHIFEAVEQTLNGEPLAGLLSLHITPIGTVARRVPETTT